MFFLFSGAFLFSERFSLTDSVALSFKAAKRRREEVTMVSVCKNSCCLDIGAAGAVAVPRWSLDADNASHTCHMRHCRSCRGALTRAAACWPR